MKTIDIIRKTITIISMKKLILKQVCFLNVILAFDIISSQ